VQADSVADDCPAAQAARSPAALPEPVVPDDYSLPVGLPVRVAPLGAELRPDACSLPVLPAGCLAGSLRALPADYPAGSLPELELPLSPEALVLPEDVPAHSQDASSAILAAAKAGPDVVPTLAVWRQTQVEVEAELLWRLQGALRLLAAVLPLVPPCWSAHPSPIHAPALPPLVRLPDHLQTAAHLPQLRLLPLAAR
jgi:hypothetical protein